MHFTEYDVRLAAYAAIVNENREILLAWYNGEGRLQPRWTMPGGGVEFEETIEEAAVREVYEETGFHVDLGPLLAINHFTDNSSSRSAKPFRSQQFLFSATITAGELGTTEVGGTTDLARWIPLDDLPHLPEGTSRIVEIAWEAFR